MLSEKAYYILGFSFLISGFLIISASFGGITGLSVLEVVEVDAGIVIGVGFFIAGFLFLAAFRKLQKFLIDKGIEGE